MNFSIDARRVQAAALLLAVASVFVACRDGGGDSSNRQGGEERLGPVTGLIAPPTTAFDVRFDWDRGIAGRPHGTFVWRQRDGVRRRDTSDETTRGSFRIESDVNMTQSLAQAGISVGCDWAQLNDSTSLIATCSSHGASDDDDLYAAIDAALRSGGVTARLADRQIAGIEATCYQYSGESEGTICVDGAGTPLYFTGFSPPLRRRETIVATSVSRSVQTLRIPEPLPPDVNLGFAPKIDASELQLPE